MTEREGRKEIPERRREERRRQERSRNPGFTMNLFET